MRAACCIYPTAAFLDPAVLRLAKVELDASGADYAFTIVAYRHPIERALRIGPEGRVELVDVSYRSSRTQDLKPSFYDAGQFYWGTRDAWIGRLPILGGDAIAIPLGPSKAPDIDTEEDWILAERLFSTLKLDRKEPEMRNGQ